MSFQIIAEVISLGDRKLNKQLADIMNKYLSRIKNLLAHGIETGEIRNDIDLDATAMLIFGMVESLSNYWTLNNYKFNIEDKIVPMRDIFHKAVAVAGTKETVSAQGMTP